MELPKTLFWDTDYSQISWDKHARFVIVRVVSRGNLADWQTILSYYGTHRIQEALSSKPDT